MLLKKVTHVIFDMDGLLIESESADDRIISEIAAAFGKKYTKDMRVQILGTVEEDTAKIAIREMDLPFTIDEFLEVYKPKIREQVQHPPLMPGVRKLVQHLHRHNIPIAVATSSSYEAMKLKTQDHQDVFGLFDHIVCGSSDPAVKKGKPAPDIFLVCASRFADEPEPEQCLVLEDAPNGTRGAITAGMQAVLIPSPDLPQESRKPASLVLNSMTEFKPEVFGLPAFD